MKNINEVKEQQLNSVSGESDYEYYTENGETHKVSKTVDNKIQLLSPKSTDNKINGYTAEITITIILIQ